MSLLALLLGALALWLALAAGLLLAFRRPLLALWREPVLRHPVLVIESDDWGVGPPEQAGALRELAGILCRHRDCEGRPALMTLALVLARAEPESLLGAHRRRELDHPEFAEVLRAIEAGERQGCFALQLHGHEHYWPQALLAAAAEDPAVRAWVADPAAPTEDLPSALQSRWTDATRLPSAALAEAEVDAAVDAEVAAYRRILGRGPEVVVPPTFLWTARVEQAWAKAGIHTVVTPGERLAARDAAGRPAGAWGRVRNAERGAGGVRYLVRDVYFEPAFGHRAERLLAGVAARRAQGRPALVETHRCNFIGEPLSAARHLEELDSALGQALARHPDLRFLDTATLGVALAGRDPAWCEQAWRPRLAAWAARLPGLPRFWSLARLTGWAPLLRAVSAA